MELFGRRQIFCDAKVIDKSNILEVLSDAYVIHQQNRVEMLYLFNYAKGRQPILDREKEIRPEINEKVVDNMATEILEFKLGYEFGSPITYVQRARKDIKSRLALFSFIKGILTSDESKKEDCRVAALNEMMVEECKAAKDLMLAKDVKTCGVGYRLIYPKKIKTGVSVFDLLVLNPMNTFVVYSNDAYREPMLGVTYFEHRDGSITFGCYTKISYFEIKLGGVVDNNEWIIESPNIIGQIPIVEYINDYDRMGCFERVIPLMDALNTIDSDRVNDIAQHVQNILWGDNVKLDSEQYKKLREQGLIITKSDQGRTATLKYLECVLDQSENQTLVDYVKQQILDITNTPSRSELSGGSTGSATNMSTGWMAAETDAKEKEQIWSASERRETYIILQILKISNEVDADVAELNLSDIEIKFSRSRTYDLATKCNSLATLIKIGIDPLRAIEVVGLFTDPQQVTLDSAERIDKILFKDFVNQSNGNDSDDDPYKKQQPDITDQPSKVSVSDQ
nr:MAG TPA: Portal [Caudoviricetes sp.]